MAYGRSKTANILFAVEFDRRHKAAGIRATAVHPGGIATELGRYAYASSSDALRKRVDQINAEHAAAGKPAFSSEERAAGSAATSVWAGVVAPAEAVGGRYCENCHVAERVWAATPSSEQSARACALCPLILERAKALWAKSEEDGGRNASDRPARPNEFFRMGRTHGRGRRW